VISLGAGSKNSLAEFFHKIISQLILFFSKESISLSARLISGQKKKFDLGA
jgi:hypothetical protein